MSFVDPDTSRKVKMNCNLKWRESICTPCLLKIVLYIHIETLHILTLVSYNPAYGVGCKMQVVVHYLRFHLDHLWIIIIWMVDSYYKNMYSGY